eukprot:TRINITY_DN1307_c0_g1_i1.p1 TRINITY_DN1307_c0_g1~~TRINITY_DN1307_c0_g1_i1.p1  ORF type:complete len:912 (-),score=135.45 TRINITY_DN1307_c0_g1_i1:123-2756(-)
MENIKRVLLYVSFIMFVVLVQAQIPGEVNTAHFVSTQQQQNAPVISTVTRQHGNHLDTVVSVDGSAGTGATVTTTVPASGGHVLVSVPDGCPVRVSTDGCPVLPATQPADPCDGRCGSSQQCTQDLYGRPSCQCLPGYRTIENADGTITCIDVDECLGNPCHERASCFNYPGSYECKCQDGYEGDGKMCRQLSSGSFPVQGVDHGIQYSDELEFRLKPPHVLRINQLEARVYNDPGWFFISKRGPTIQGQPEVWTDSLPVGMRRGEVGWYTIRYHAKDSQGVEAEPQTRIIIVEDIDECALGIAKCSINANCRNTNGSYECVCKPGFEGDGIRCVDIDECSTGIAKCHQHADCINTVGSYMCRCRPGFRGDGFNCEDINECLRPEDNNCHQYADCHNTIGSYTCTCKPGYDGDGINCYPRDPCLEPGLCHPNATCNRDRSRAEGYVCTCKPGFQGDGHLCEDINECLDPSRYPCPPHSHCRNIVGSYVCDCDPGFYRPAGSQVCIDIDECALDTHDCDRNARCINTEGSYRCVCKEGYIGNGRVCEPEVAASRFKLNGANPYLINQCDSYSEEGLLIDDSASDTVRYTSFIPPVLTGHIVLETGEYEVKYVITEGGKPVEELLRRVIIKPINRCNLPEGHPCRHTCHRLAVCVFDPEVRQGYRCECPPGFSPVLNERGDLVSCKDNIPPEITLRGENPAYLIYCKICSFVDTSATWSEDRNGGYSAVDIFPDGSRDDLTSLVTVTKQIVNDTEFNLVYNVRDRAGNAAPTKVRRVISVVEDVHKDIMLMKAVIERRFGELEPKTTRLDAFFDTVWRVLWWVLFIIVMLALWYFIPRVWNFIAVLIALSSGEEVPFEKYMEAFDFWFTIRHPMMTNRT